MSALRREYTILEHRGIVVALYDPPNEWYCYLLHFDRPYYHARHYLGLTGCLEKRLELHRHGTSRACLMGAVHDAGIGLQLARLWPVSDYEDGHKLERSLKDRHNGPRLCPICRGESLDPLVLWWQHRPHRSAWEKPKRRQPMSKELSSPLFLRRE
jgi:hypothetical protein